MHDFLPKIYKCYNGLTQDCQIILSLGSSSPKGFPNTILADPKAKEPPSLPEAAVQATQIEEQFGEPSQPLGLRVWWWSLEFRN